MPGTARARRAGAGPWRSFLAAGLVMLGACARHDYTPAPLSPDDFPADLAAATLASQNHAELFASLGIDAPFPPPAWSGAQLALIGVHRSPALAAARAELATLAAARRVAASPRDAGFGLRLEHNSDLDPGDDSRWSVGPEFEFLWSPVDKGRIRVALADDDLVAARVRVLSVAWQARRATLNAALELEIERARAAALKARSALLTETVNLAHGQAESGLIDAFEWQLLRLEANSLHLDRAERISAGAVAGATLAASLALPLEALGGLALATTPAIDVPRRDAVQREALSRHPRILAALAAYDAREHALELAVAEQYPDITLSPGYFFDQGDNVWSLLGAIVVPWSARTDARIAQATAARDAARAQFKQVQAEVIGAVMTAHERARASAAALLEIHAALALAEQDTGAGSATLGAADTLVARRAALQQARIRENLATYALRLGQDLHELEYHAGVPFSDPVFARYLRMLYASVEAG